MNATPGIMSTGFKPSSYTNYEEEIEKTTDHLNATIKKASSLKVIDLEELGRSLKKDYTTLAECMIMTDEVPAARKYFHNIARLGIELEKIYSKKPYPLLGQTGKPQAFHSRFADGFPEAILAHDEIQLQEFSRTLEQNEAVQSDHKFGFHISSAIKYHILGDYLTAKEHAILAHKIEYFRLSWKGYSHAILGIIDRDNFLVNEGIELRIKAHKTKEFKSIFFEFCIEATALAKLAIRSGMRPNIQSPFINKKILMEGERMTENSIDELLASFDNANERKGNFFWAIRNLFSR